MATVLNGGYMPQGVIPLPQHAQPNGAQPTGQMMAPPGQQISFGLEQLPAAPQQQPPQAIPGQQPQQTYGLPPQGYVQPQQQQPPQQQQQLGWQQPPQQQMQQGQPPAGLNMQTRLQGPGVPPELQGRTFGEALGIYSALATEWAARQGRPATPAQQSLQQMQPQQQAPAQGGPQQLPWQSRVSQQQQPPGGNSSLWTNPVETIGEIIEQRVGSMLAPVVQHTQVQAVNQAYGVATQFVSDFRTLEPEVMQMLAGADASTLQNPQTWIGAADIIRGRQMREGRYQAPSQNSQPLIPGRQPQNALYGPHPGQPHNPSLVGAQPAGQPQIPAYGFFTEQPSAPSTSQFGAGQPSAQDQAYASKFGMPLDQYMQWKYGVQQSGQSQMNYQQQYHQLGAVPMGGVR